MPNELPTEAGAYYWRLDARESWGLVGVTVYHGGLYIPTHQIRLSSWVARMGAIGQWLRIPDADTLARMEAWWNVRGDITCPSGGSRGDTPAADGLPVEMVEGDPINAAYREAIKAEDVPEWANHVCALEDRTGVMWSSHYPRRDGSVYEGRVGWKPVAMTIGGKETVRRIDAVWPQRKTGGAK